MKSYCLLLCLLLFCTCLHAQTQNNEGDSEKQPAIADTAEINKLVNKSVNIYLQYPDSARAIAERAILLSKQIKYNIGIGSSFAAIGYSYWAQSYYAFSLYFLFSAESYLKDTRRYGDLSMLYRIIARNYTEMGQFNQAELYLKKSEANAALSRDNGKIALIYNESSLIDLRKKNYDGAWHKGNVALQLADKYNDTLLTGIIYSRLGDILQETGKINLIKPYLDSAYRWSKLSSNNRLRSLVLNDYANYYLAQKNIEGALASANAASLLADSTGNIAVKIAAASILANCYHAKKDNDLELAYQIKYSLLEDSSNTEYRKKGFQLFQQFFSLNSKLHDLETEEHANLVGRERIRFQHIIIVVLGMFVIILLAGLITIYFLYREKNRLVEQLADRNEAVIHQKSIIEQQSQHLVQVNDLKTKLFAVISHDLRTPISSLRSIMGLFQKQGLTEEQTVALLKKMLPALDAADLTLSNLLNWSLKQMTGLKINQSTMSLFPVVEEMARVFEFALQQKNITYSNNIPPSLKVYFDEHHLTIILRNLVSNAIKFTPQNGFISVAAKQDGDKIIISVRDTGQGMGPEDIAKLFISTSYFSTRGTSGEKGTGLGLMLCKELLELNGSSVFVESSVGKGSTFYLNLSVKPNS